MSSTPEFYQLADELRAMANMGLRYATNEYDHARYQRLLVVSARLVAILEQKPAEEMLAQFEGDLMQVCPRLGADAAIFRNGQILLTRRADNGLWCMPGGQVDVGESLAEAAYREVWEEIGVQGEIIRLLGVFDSRFWMSQSKTQLYYSTFLMEIGDQLPQTSLEVTETGFFAEDNLPPLFSSHRARVPFIFRMMRGEIPAPYYDPK